MNSLSFNALFILLLINLNILCSQDSQIGNIDSYMLVYNIISQKNISNLKQAINDHVFYTNNGKWTTTTPFIIEYTPSGFKSTITNTLSK